MLADSAWALPFGKRTFLLARYFHFVMHFRRNQPAAAFHAFLQLKTTQRLQPTPCGVCPLPILEIKTFLETRANGQ
jgi:hypothetical protein